VNYIHVSQLPNGKKGEGSTYNVGRNAAKRSRRKWIKALRRANPTIRKLMRDRGTA
jgi:hypothetical protein